MAVVSHRGDREVDPSITSGGSRRNPEVIPVGPGVDPGIMLVGAQGSPVVTPALHHGGSWDDSMVILGVFQWVLG